jgi:hypothetical protein
MVPIHTRYDFSALPWRALNDQLTAVPLQPLAHRR